ncbi:MAG: acyltransferase [Proteobacteria bacterium]|nr:acyltransferase [Pseudomonadota bacterium]
MATLAYRREIDGLRAIAVLAVVFFHAVGVPAAGYVGVDIFFVISGYLITGMLTNEHQQTGRIDVLAFYARRVRRILPAVIVVVSAVLAVGALLLPYAALIRTANSASASALFAANFFFQFTTGGYFDPSVDSMPLLHLWSLAVEEQFYLVWPALLIAMLSWSPRRTMWVTVAIGLGSLVLAEYLVRSAPQAAFYQMPSRFWELGAGALIAVSPIPKGPDRSWHANVALGCIALACFFPTPRFPGVGALPVVAATSLLLWAIHRHGPLGRAGAFLRWRPIVGIGLVSYSLYLWHWPLLAFYRATTIGAGSTNVRLALCGVALVLAVVSWRYVESPFRRLKPSKTVFAVGTACSIALAITAFSWVAMIKVDEAAQPRDNPLAVKAEGDVQPNFRKCHYQVYSTDFPRPGCESIPGVKPTIVLWGDSMAMTWHPLIDAMGQRRGKSAIDYSRDSCGPFVGYLPPHPMPGDYKCRDWNAKVLQQAEQADVVVLVAFWNNGETNGHIQEFTSRLRPTLLALSPHVGHIILIGATPIMRDKVPHCIRLNAVDRCAVDRREFDVVAMAAMTQLRAAAAGLANVEYIDPADFFCTRTTCPAIRYGIPLYYDDHHIAHSAAVRYVHDVFDRH